MHKYVILVLMVIFFLIIIQMFFPFVTGVYFLILIGGFFLCGLVLSILSFRKKWFLITGLSAVGFFVFVILHNAFYALNIIFPNILIDILGAGFFLIAVLVCPVLFLIGSIISIYSCLGEGKKYILIILILSILFGFAILFYQDNLEFEIDFHKIEFPTEEKGLARLKLFDDVREELFISGKSFLEVNLDKMMVSLYKFGVKVKQVPILTRGDTQTWGGSAVGLYKILSGSTVGYSNTSNVYMPYYLHYYGKYYIHGEPYYYKGYKLESPFSGGCLRLKDIDAELIYELSELNMPVLVIDKERDDYQYEKPETMPYVSAKSFLVADLDSGHILAEKDSERELPIASLTKLMTAVVVAENVNLKRSILIREEMLNGYGHTEGLDIGERFRVVELFYPLLIESSNDAAETLSYFLGREKTIRLMNEKAKSILMENTVYTCPSGYDSGNVSTAKDLFYLARYIFNNRFPLLEIGKGKKVRSFGDINFDTSQMYNMNVFINDPYFIGGKTGFIKASKYTGIFLFKFFDENSIKRNIAIIVLGSNNEKLDTQIIYRWLQDNYFGPQYLLD